MTLGQHRKKKKKKKARARNRHTKAQADTELPLSPVSSCFSRDTAQKKKRGKIENGKTLRATAAVAVAAAIQTVEATKKKLVKPWKSVSRVNTVCRR